MIKKIWKFEMDVDDNNFIPMPKGAEILSVQLQHNRPVIWALVDPSTEDKEVRHIEMFGTGHSINFDAGQQRKFLGTIQPAEAGNSFAFHVFERIS